MLTFTRYGKIDAAKIKEAIETKIFNDFGKEIEITFDEENRMETSFRISTSTIGSMALMISRLDVTVSASFDLESRKIGVAYGFKYSHTDGGSNGNTVRKIYDFSGKEV